MLREATDADLWPKWDVQESKVSHQGPYCVKLLLTVSWDAMEKTLMKTVTGSLMRSKVVC